MTSFDWLPTSIATAASAAIMIVGGVLTDKTGWYASLNRPGWQPPDWAFAPAWTTIYALVTWATVLAWTHADSFDARMIVVIAFGLNGVLNMGWSLIFFKWRRPDLALLETVPLWLSTVLLAAVYHRAVSLAGWLIAPYVAWVAFAAVLNLAIVRLNWPTPRASTSAGAPMVRGAALDGGRTG